jgi:hypothetical protein
MQALPNAEGWGPNMNSAPQVFGEYNSKDGYGNAVNTSQRKTDFSGTYLKTVWSESDAKDYTLANILGGSDSWTPEKYSAQVKAPTVSLDATTKTITWNADGAALCWAIFKNGTFEALTTDNQYTFKSISDKDVITVRAANSMGGLGSAATALPPNETRITPTVQKNHFQYTSSTRARLFTVNGKLLRESLGSPVSTHGLNRGLYLLQVENGNIRKQQLIQVR